MGFIVKREIAKYSIRGIGLFYPIVINENDELVARLRRLEAFEILGYKEIPVTIIDIKNLIEGEFIENKIRADLLPSEMVAAYEKMEEHKRGRKKKDEIVSESDTIKRQKRAAKVLGTSTNSLKKWGKLYKDLKISVSELQRCIQFYNKTKDTDFRHIVTDFLEFSDVLENWSWHYITYDILPKPKFSNMLENVDIRR